jgi:hypothetical protein
MLEDLRKDQKMLYTFGYSGTGISFELMMPIILKAVGYAEMEQFFRTRRGRVVERLKRRSTKNIRKTGVSCCICDYGLETAL